MRFADGSIIVSHNIAYDIKYINIELEKMNLNIINTQKCICTMTLIKKLNILKNYKLKDCAKFYDINGIRDYHKGIVDVIVLAFIVCKMAEKNDKNYNIHKYKHKVTYKINKNRKVFVIANKYHLYSTCINLINSRRIIYREAIKDGKELCKRCKIKYFI